MTSSEPTWPYAPPAGTAAPTSRRPGVETRQVLLTLGAVCLVVAFSAGTALVWSALGSGGQLALMATVTAGLLVGAAALRGLPATAEALGAVGLAGCAVDGIAARTLHLSFAVGLPLHWYVAIAALGTASVAVALGAAAPRLVVAPVAWSGAVLVAAVAAVGTSHIDRAALLAPMGICVAAGLDLVLRRLPGTAAPARAVNAAGGSLVAVIGFGAAVLASAQHDAAGWWGATLPLALFALPRFVEDPAWAHDDASASLSGVAAASLLMAATIHTGATVRSVEAVGLPVLAVSLLLLSGGGRWIRRVQIAGSAVAVPGAMAWMSLIADTQRFANVDFALAAAAVGVALAWPRTRPAADDVRVAALAVATVLTCIAATITLHRHGVTTPEAYVATPAGLLLAWGAGFMFHDRGLPSLVLAPGLTFGLFPTLAMALGTDHERQAVLLVIATILVALGAELRLGTPLVAGTAIISLLGIRVIGPEVGRMPHWVMWAAAGSVLLTLGATWEARVDDARRVQARMQPRICALR